MAEMAPALAWSCRIGSSFVHTKHACGLSFSDALSSSSPLRLQHLQQQQQQQQQHHRSHSFQVSSVTSTSAPPSFQKKDRSSQAPKGAPRRKWSGPRQVILKPPMDDKRLAERFLDSPQLSLKSLPLLSSCLPPAPLRSIDHDWMEENLLEIKEALGYPLEGMENPAEDTPLFHFDTLLYLAFQHQDTERSMKGSYVRIGHSRLWFLGQYILEQALAEFFLQRYPRETPACIRERMFGLTSKKVLPQWVKAAALDAIIFPDVDMDRVKAEVKERAVRSVFWALMGALYLTMGMGEVYRVLFEVFGMDPDAKSCRPKPRLGRDDDDYVSPELDEKQLTWQDVALYKTPDDSVFAKPRLFRACVPPGMHRFRGNLWEVDSLPEVLRTMGYPLPSTDGNPDTTLARNAELELGLQLCFLHPSMYKQEHPRFCNERFEFLGQKIQDVVMAEKLLMKHLDGPGMWLQEKHRRLLFNRVCGKYLREKKLQRHVLYAEDRQEAFDRSRRLRNFATTAVQQALHGLGYAVYGKAEVRRLMFRFFDFEQLQAAK